MKIVRSTAGRVRLLSVAAIVLLVAPAVPATASQAAVAATPAAGVYRVVDLGSLGGRGAGEATAINDEGYVVGYSAAPGGTHPFLWHDGVMTDLGVLEPDAPYAAASDINSQHEVVGSCDVAGGTAMHAFLWRRGVLTDLGTLGGTYSVATAINDRGQVVGTSSTADGAWHGFIWEHGRMTDLGVDSVTGVDNRGDIIGNMNFPTGYHGYLMSRGKVTDLGVLPGGSQSEAHAINNRGEVVGDADSAAHPGARGAFTWRNGTMRELPGLDGTYSNTVTMNDRGQVLGLSMASGSLRPVLWQNGAITDLTTKGITSEGMGQGAGQLRGINNSGQIVGSYYFTYGQPGPALFVASR